MINEHQQSTLTTISKRKHTYLLAYSLDMSAIQSQLADMTREQLIERIQKMERLCQASAKDATEQAEKVAELEHRLNDETAWEEHEKMLTDAASAKIEELKEEVDSFKKRPKYAEALWERDCAREELAKLKTSVYATGNYWMTKYENQQSELEGFKSICNEYLCGPEASWEDLFNWCKDKTDEIVEIREEVEDLEEQVAELQTDIACLQEALTIVKDENEVNKKNLRQATQ